MSQDTRANFSERYVTRRYLEQDGVCANVTCKNPLGVGFHRHHASGDNSDDSYSNLTLLCMECHHALKDKEGLNRLEAHHVVEREVYDSIKRMVAESFNGKLSGANMERMMDGFIKMLQISRNEKRIDSEVEYPPPEIQMLFTKSAVEEKQALYLEAYMEGVKATVSKLGVKTVE
jgi:hypothetical protein